MAQREPNRLLAVLLAETDWTAGELARAVNTLGSAQGMRLRYDRTSVAHWLSGSRPRGPVPSLIAAALTERLARPVTPGDAGLSRSSAPPTRQPERAAGLADYEHSVFSLIRADVDPTRHTFATRTTYTVSALKLPAVASPPTRPRTRLSHHGTATNQHLQSMRDMTRLFATLYLRHGGGYARKALASYVAHDTAQALSFDQPEHLHGDLLTTTSQLLHQLAEMTADCGNEGLAQQYLHRALLLAAQAGDRNQYLITLRTLSSQALRLGNRHYANHLVRAALEHTNTATSPAIKSFLHSQRAVTLSCLNHSQASHDHLQAAEHHHALAESAAGPFTDYPRAALDYQRAQALHAMQEHGAEQRAYSSAIRQRPDSHHRPAALTQAKFAHHLLNTGEIEPSCAHWHAFLDHYAHLHSSQADHAFSLLTHQIRAYQHHPKVKVLLDRIRTVKPH